MSLVSAKIEDVCSIGDGAHASIKRVSEGVPYLTSKNFKIDGLDLSKLDYISNEDYKKHFNGKSKAITKPIYNDIMLSIIGSIGAPHLVRNSGEFGLSSSVSILRPNEDKILPAFLYYWLKSDFFQKSIQQIKSGVAQSFLSLGMIKSLPVNYFESLKTQKRIADILSAYDDLIENNIKRIKLLEQAAQNIYKEWFVNLRFPSYENTSINEETGLPEGFEEKSLSDLVSKITDGTHDSPKPKDKGFYLVTGKNINNGFLDFSNAYLISKEDHDKVQKRSFLELGDILYSNIGTIGSTTIVDQDFKYSCKNVIIFKPLEFHSFFLYCFLTNTHTKSLFLQGLAGSSQKFISLTYARGYKEIFPSTDRIVLFHNTVKDFFKQKKLLHRQNQKLKAARDILLPRLMNRTIEV
jgi:type I restriction enzyme S subunit